MNFKNTSALIAIAISGGIFVLDRWTKLSVTSNPPVASSSWITTTLHKNHGLIANTPVPLWLIMLFSVFAILAVIAFLIREWQKNNFFSVFACMLILSGAFGNLIDRIRFGYVIDWILLFQLSIFNISDIAIGAGIIILLLTQRPKSGTQ